MFFSTGLTIYINLHSLVGIYHPSVQRASRVQLKVLLGDPEVRRVHSTRLNIAESLSTEFTTARAFALHCVTAIGQGHVFDVLPNCPEALKTALATLADDMLRLEEFYDSIGGLAGYQLQCLRLILERQRADNGPGPQNSNGTAPVVEYLVPPGLDMARDAASTAVAAARGLEGLPHMAEIYPLGGAGDRLGLCCDCTGDSLPTAVLPYCGRSLLESLIRDLQAREYLYFRVYGRQLTTPAAVMTSAAKGNHWRVECLFEEAGWFGRGRSAFKLFQQPLVPVIGADDGQWLMCDLLQPMMKPGGHGVIWKLMLDNGVFDWLHTDNNRQAAIVRQISNPMAGQDVTLLALSGEGLRGRRAFGFASCERVVGAAEGMNVLLKQRETVEAKNGAEASSPSCSYRITNVEYTEFERLGIEDKGAEEGSSHSAFPANTNVLFVGLRQIESMVKKGVAAGTTEEVLPGMILNLGKEVHHVDVATGEEMRTRAGRLECTMQNLADCFATPIATEGRAEDVIDAEVLDTFLVYGPRRKVTSSAKRQRTPGSQHIHQTPDGSFYDLMQNAADMLTMAGFEVPAVGSVADYLEGGPGFIFLFHPALGPLWSVVAQKLRGGRMASGAEVQLEIAEADIVNLDVDGSFLVLSDAPLGCHKAAQIEGAPELVYSDACSRIRLRNVRVRNAGIDWTDESNVYWRHRVARKETCRVVLHGNAEFYAADVEFVGARTYVVPDGYRLRVRQGGDGQTISELEKVDSMRPSWKWQYQLRADGHVALSLIE